MSPLNECTLQVPFISLIEKMRRHVIYVICTKDHLKKIAVLLDILYMEVGGGRPLSVEKSKLKNCLKSFEMLQILDFFENYFLII